MRWIKVTLLAMNLFISQAFAGTSLHYASGLASKTLGFNLADVNYADQLNALPAGMKGLVWLGKCNGADSDFISAVTPFIGNPKLFGFYLMDEPDPTGIWSPQCTAAHLKEESDWIHANVPGAQTFVVLVNLGTNANPSYVHSGLYYGPDNTHIDLFGVDAYPCLSEYGTACNYNLIDAAINALHGIGVPDNQIVPVYQAYGCNTASFGNCVDDVGGYTFIPSAAQEEEMIAHWAALLPNPAFDYAYTWNVSDIQFPLSTLPELQGVLANHNMPPQNLLTNSGLESGLTGWTSWGNSEAVTSPAYDGMHSLRVGTGDGGVYQDVTSKLTAGGIYDISFAAQLGSASDQTAQIGIEFFDSLGNVTYDQHLSPSSTNWTPMTLTFTCPPGASSALVYVWKNNGSSYVYVDSITLAAH